MRRILILKPCCLGDVLMATPMLAALAEAYPDADIHWAVGQHSRPAILGHPHLSTLLDASHCIKGEFRSSAFLRLLRSIRRGRYDTLVVPDRSPILSLLASLSGVPTRAGLASGWRGFGYTHPLPVDPDAHEALLYLSLAKALIPQPADILSLDSPRVSFHPSQADHDAAQAALRERLGDRRETFDGIRISMHPAGGVNPGMTLLSKRWPADRFAALAERLIQEENAMILLLGGPDDRSVADEVLSSLTPSSREQVINLSGHLSIGSTGAAIQLSALYIGNDTGVSHIACGVGTPTLMIFGPTNPKRYGPLPGAGLAVSPTRLDSEPVEDTSLKSAIDSSAIDEITVDQAWECAQRLLDSQQA